MTECCSNIVANAMLRHIQTPIGPPKIPQHSTNCVRFCQVATPVTCKKLAGSASGARVLKFFADIEND